MPSDDPDRQRRLAEALRANLRRRKGQDRARERETQSDPAIEATRPDNANPKL